MPCYKAVDCLLELLEGMELNLHRSLLCVFLLLSLPLAGVYADAETEEQAPQVPIWTPPEQTRVETVPPELESAVTNLWFPLGESLQYRVYWGFIPVARSVVTNELVEENGKVYLAIRFRTKSNGVLNKIYPVDDYIESIIDLETFLPIRFMKDINEGRYHTREITTFDHANKKAVWYRIKDDKKEVLDIESDTRDIVSFMYYMRSQKKFEEGEEKQYRVMADEKVYDLYVKADEVEKFRLCDYGWVESMKFEPEAAFGGLFVRHKGKMWLWVSQDPRNIVTKVKAKVPVASVSILISGVSGPGDDFWVKECKYRDEFGVDEHESIGDEESKE